MKNTKIIISFFFLLFMFVASAQTNKSKITEQTQVSTQKPDSAIQIPDDISNSLDYLMHNWMVSQIADYDCDSIDFPKNLPDSIIKLRLKMMPCIMEMPYNNYIRSFIDLYTVKKRRQMSFMLGMSDYYFRIFEQVLEKNKLPLELKYLPVIESALHATAVSRVGAAGLWQFMIATGRMYGLEINSLVDERLDPVKSTHAAALFLKDLYSIYGDWHLVIAAYNCGPGNVNKAIRRAGGKKDYWEIYPYLPRETRGYVPVFIAANYAMHYAPEHNICKVKVPLPRVLDTVMISQRLHLEQIATVLELPLEQVQLMNPQYRRNIIPGDIKPYPVTLPVRKVGMFIDKLEEIAGFKSDSLVNNRRSEIEIAEKKNVSGSGANENIVYHKVKKGQNLGGIAAKYGVSVSKIKKWNNLSGSLINEGQKLIIYK